MSELTLTAGVPSLIQKSMYLSVLDKHGRDDIWRVCDIEYNTEDGQAYVKIESMWYGDKPQLKYQTIKADQIPSKIRGWAYGEE